MSILEDFHVHFHQPSHPQSHMSPFPDSCSMPRLAVLLPSPQLAQFAKVMNCLGIGVLTQAVWDLLTNQLPSQLLRGHSK